MISNYYHVNNIKLHVLENGPLTGPVLIFLHGYPEFSYAWRAQLHHFGSKGFRAIAPDQRGYNLSDKPTAVKAYRMEELVEDIVGLIQIVSKDRKVTLVGHDWGGAVAWHIAMYYPKLLQHLVIINMPHPAVMLATLKKNGKQQLKSSYMAYFQLPLLPELISSAFNFSLMENAMLKTAEEGTFSDMKMQYYKQAWRQKSALRSMINWYRAYKYSKLPANRTVEVPALIIWGKKDQFLKKEMAEGSLDFCSKGKLEMFDDATHWIHHEKSEVVNRLIFNFIEEKSSVV